MAATVVFEVAREIAKNVTKAVIREKKLGSEFGTGARGLFWLFDGGSGSRGFEGGGRWWWWIGGGGGGVRVWIGIGGSERTVA
jgi:hypothetical protein